MSAEGETAAVPPAEPAAAEPAAAEPAATEAAYDPEDSVNTSAVSGDVSVPDDPLSVASPA